MVMAELLLTQPVVAFLTVSVALNNPPCKPVNTAGIAITIGVAPKTASVTSAKPAVLAVASKTMLYLSGVSVVALKGRLPDVVPIVTSGFEPRVMVGSALLTKLTSS